MLTVQLLVMGDSFAEGRGDPAPDGSFVGWVPRVADALGISRNAVLNLGAYGATSQDVIDSQLDVAVAKNAPLTAVMVGGNDLVRAYDRGRFRANLEKVLTTLCTLDTTIFAMTYPDIPGHIPGLSEDFRAELRARFADANEFVCPLFARLGVLYYDMARSPLMSDPTTWAPDGIHASPTGYLAIAREIAELLGSTWRRNAVTV